jgi:tRNA A-37 threonylcarbamoyl transferase component Bud32/predicted nucleotidyltransferase
LKPEESLQLLDVAQSVVGGEKGRVVAVAAYGSKIAGYSRPDSDYDIIVVAKKFKGRIRYQYIKTPVMASALVVDEGLLEGDAVKGSLGEFVSGRLLNVYQPLLNGELLDRAEVAFKKRVLLEEILEIGSQHGEFAQDLLIPLDYFLFDKLHKRALIYPPALYSYIRTYTCPFGAENRALALEGFATAALSLQATGVLRIEEKGRGHHDDDTEQQQEEEGEDGREAGGRTHEASSDRGERRVVELEFGGDRVKGEGRGGVGAPGASGLCIRILGEGLRSRAFARLLSLFNLTKRGVRQYAVHGYAGRVGLNVFKDEALSKVKRMQEKFEPPPELEEPKRLIELKEGFVLPKMEQMVDRLASLSGLVAYTRRERSLGEIYSTARLVTLRAAPGTDAGRQGVEARFVFKHFADIRSVKWALLNVWSLSRKFSTSPQARMHREYHASLTLRSRGVATPRIIGAVLDDKILVKEYVEGERFSDIVQDILVGRSHETLTVERFGEAIGIIHRAGFALGDSKATNVIVTRDGSLFYFTDLEQATEGGDQAWDIAAFIYYQAKLSLKETGMKTVAGAFLEGYRRINGPENISRAKNPKYMVPFRPITVPQVLRTVRESLEANSA